jgi:hypothetical protein
MERVKEAGTPNVVGHGSGSGTREIDAASSHLKSPCRHDQRCGKKLLEAPIAKLGVFSTGLQFG